MRPIPSFFEWRAPIQEIEVEQFNRRAAHRNHDRVDPIYEGANVTACLELFRPHHLGDWFAVFPGLRARFWNAGRAPVRERLPDRPAA